MKNIDDLRLISTKVGDASLEELAALKKLSFLGLGSTAVTDAGVKKLAALKSVRSLDISYNKNVTDVGVKELVALKNLYWLDLSETNVTIAQKKELRKALPMATIVK